LECIASRGPHKSSLCGVSAVFGPVKRVTGPEEASPSAVPKVGRKRRTPNEVILFIGAAS
jgi:hypothetical protein